VTDEHRTKTPDLVAAVRDAARQEQFLEVVAVAEARRRFHRHLDLAPLAAETVALAQALGRVLAADVAAPIDVPPFDRSGVDGFAVRAADTAGAADRAVPNLLAGKPLTITDPNGVVTTLTYDLRQRLISRQVATEVTSYSYWPTGLSKRVTLPDSSYVESAYDGAHRLTGITDGAGNHETYTLDAMGNITARNTYDPGSTLHRTHSRVINALDQLYQDVNAAGTAAVTTTYSYDANGNPSGTAAPLGRNTTDVYDELNRVKQINDANLGVTRFGYDPNDMLVSVTDPRSLVTSYTYNGFGDLTHLSSPDTGGTSNVYDSAGNIATSTNARGAVATYQHDSLNRVTSAAFAIGGVTDQTITYSYDAGANGKGRLTGASDSNQSLSWAYDALGRVTGKSQKIGTTISLFDRLLQAICPGNASTSGTISVSRFCAAVPQTPFPNSICRQPTVPIYGPTTRRSPPCARCWLPLATRRSPTSSIVAASKSIFRTNFEACWHCGPRSSKARFQKKIN